MTALVTEESTSNKNNNNKAYGKIYTSLDIARHEIRLLTLHPATNGDDRIWCSLSHADLMPSDSSASPSYEALSYVWGKPDFSELILLNHQEFFITPSLKYALSCLRSKTQPRILWVDAICINQSDVVERNHQVALMRDIYSQCQRDIAWLDPVIGKDLELEDRYNDPRLSELEESIRKGMDLMRAIVQKDHKTLQGMFRYLGKDGYQLDIGDESCLRALFDSPTLWQRLWVMQELSLAPDLVLMCRDAELSWKSLSDLLTDEPYFDAFHVWRSSHDGRDPSWSDIFVRFKLIEDQRRLFSESGPSNSKMMDVLARFRAMESTDPRDRIYSLLGLVTENHGIDVDYTISVPDLYRETTISLINLSGNLDILCQSPFEESGGHDALHKVEGAMPSWVAEFSSSYKDSVDVLFAQRGIFNAGIKNCETPCRLLGPERDILVVRGVVLGTIAPVLEDRTKKYGAHSIMKLYLGEEEITNAKQHIYAPKFGNKTVKTGETCLRAFWRTLVKDCTLPPRMRRLRSHEIRYLSKRNQSRLGHQRIIGVETIRPKNDSRMLKHKHRKRCGQSLFAYYSYRMLDYVRLREVYHTWPAGSLHRSYTTKDYMFAVTENGLYVLARPHVGQGDVVAILDGGKVPMILRKAVARDLGEQMTDTYRVVGPAYVHGFMDGKAEVGASKGWLKKQDILLV
ncbi:hypothetical protein FLONG3_9303 [Fusarium longipes]|uniref:Heterokaryon incompatibility domain-containing protein n=1 Tax=Fusarium longipes TaxID=694270 RepID=A0A395RYN7_9HYPO|nr:hypothetical protein FLONG3_9303 [Fusarium longipes]